MQPEKKPFKGGWKESIKISDKAFGGRETISAPSDTIKNYLSSGTITLDNTSCFFPKSFDVLSYSTDCLNCLCCHQHQDEPREEKRRSYNQFVEEESWNKFLFDIPIVVSRHCDPFLSFPPKVKRHTYPVIEEIYKRDNIVILQTGLLIPDDIILDKLKTQIQLKFVSSTKSNLSEKIKNIISPNILSTNDQLLQCKKYLELGFDVVAYIEHFILGINNLEIKMLIKELSSVGIKKIIIRPEIPSTKDYNKLRLMVSSNWFGMFIEKIKGYWYYDNLKLVQYLMPVYEECNKYNIKMTVCMNKYVNKVFNKDVSWKNNCCQLELPFRAYYDIDSSSKKNRIKNV